MASPSSFGADGHTGQHWTLLESEGPQVLDSAGPQRPERRSTPIEVLRERWRRQREPLARTPLRIDMRTALSLPVRLRARGARQRRTTGDVSSGNLDRFLDVTASIIRSPVLMPICMRDTPAANARSGRRRERRAESGADELRMLRRKGSGGSYYGAAHHSYSSGGIAGLGYLGVPPALGWDDPIEAGATAAHEFGHKWDRRHSPCRNPANVDTGIPMSAPLSALTARSRDQS